MTEEGRRVLRPAHRIALGPDVYTVIQINGTAVTLLDERGDLSAMTLGYLLTVSGFKALDALPPRRVPQDGRLSTLDKACLRHGYWLHREGAGDRLNPAILLEIAKAQRRLHRAARRSSTNTVARAYGVARASLCDLSRPITSPALPGPGINMMVETPGALASYRCIVSEDPAEMMSETGHLARRTPPAGMST